MSDLTASNVDGERPATILEAAMHALGEDVVEAETVLWVLTASDLLLPEVGQGEDSVALVIEEEDGEYVAVFTHPDQVPDMGEFDPVFNEITGLDALMSIPSDTGLAVNPGAETSIAVDADNVAEFREHLSDIGLISRVDDA